MPRVFPLLCLLFQTCQIIFVSFHLCMSSPISLLKGNAFLFLCSYPPIIFPSHSESTHAINSYQADSSFPWLPHNKNSSFSLCFNSHYCSCPLTVVTFSLDVPCVSINTVIAPVPAIHVLLCSCQEPERCICCTTDHHPSLSPSW